jgi:hypothetical protein
LTHAALLDWIRDKDEAESSSASSLDLLRANLVVPFGKRQPGSTFAEKWASSSIQRSGDFFGKSLRNPLAIGTVLRLLRFLENDQQDQWMSDFLAMTRTNRKCVSVLASIPEWQPCLFSLISETLEHVNARRQSIDESNNQDERQSGQDLLFFSETTLQLRKHLDLSLKLYSTLLGHLFREGGDQVRSVLFSALRF